MAEAQEKNPHYYKNTPVPQVDVYRVLKMFNVTDPCIQHAVKKLLVSGGRGAGKDADQDVFEAGLSIARYQEMRREEVGVNSVSSTPESELPRVVTNG